MLRLLLLPIGVVLALYGFLGKSGSFGTFLGWVGVVLFLAGALLNKRFPSLPG